MPASGRYVGRDPCPPVTTMTALKPVLEGGIAHDAGGTMAVAAYAPAEMQPKLPFIHRPKQASVPSAKAVHECAGLLVETTGVLATTNAGSGFVGAGPGKELSANCHTHATNTSALALPENGMPAPG
jgi:hypothetical protein